MTYWHQAKECRERNVWRFWYKAREKKSPQVETDRKLYKERREIRVEFE
jgi:hypothetical protein